MTAKRAFLSYQTAEKRIAGSLKELCEKCGLQVFLAHEDINVSDEWRLRILSELGRTEIFIALLSENYMKSSWCVQEAGIAAFRQDCTIIPLSLDGTISPGFISHIQSRTMKQDQISIGAIMPGLLRHDKLWALSCLVKYVAEAVAYRDAEARFEELLPFVDELDDSSAKELFVGILHNGQIHHASKCIMQYIPQLYSRYSHLLDKYQKSTLLSIAAQYEVTLVESAVTA